MPNAPWFGRTLVTLTAALIVVGGGAGIVAADPSKACLTVMVGSGNLSPGRLDFTFLGAQVHDYGGSGTGIMCHGDKKGTAMIVATNTSSVGVRLLEVTVHGSDTENGKLVKIDLHVDMGETGTRFSGFDLSGTVTVGASTPLELSGEATLVFQESCTCVP